MKKICQDWESVLEFGYFKSCFYFFMNNLNQGERLKWHTVADDKISKCWKMVDMGNNHQVAKNKGVVEFVNAAQLLKESGVKAEFCLLGFLDVQNPFRDVQALRKHISEANPRNTADQGLFWFNTTDIYKSLISIFDENSIILARDGGILPQNYQLKGLIRNVNRNHWICLVKFKNGQWYEIDSLKDKQNCLRQTEEPLPIAGDWIVKKDKLTWR